MVRLIIFECRKHFFKKSILWVLVLFCMINTIKIGSVYHENSLLSGRFSGKWGSIYQQQYESFRGEITLDKIGVLIRIYKPLEKQTADLTASTATDHPNMLTGNLYSDYFFFRDCFVRPMEYSYRYKQNANEIVLAAKENIRFFLSHKNDYEARKNIAISDIYNGREITSFAYTEMYQYYLQYDFSVLLCLLVCLYGLVNVFVMEKETEMNALLYTGKAGGIETIIAKILASALFITFVSALFWLTDFVAFAVFFGSVEGSASPIYALQNFEYAGVNISLLQYAFLSGALKTGGMLTMGMGFLAVSTLFKNALAPFLFSLTGVAGILLTSQLCESSSKVFQKIVNPFILTTNHALFRKTEFLNFFGFPIQSYVAALACAIVWSAAFVAVIIYFGGKNVHFGKGGSRCANSTV